MFALGLVIGIGIGIALGIVISALALLLGGEIANSWETWHQRRALNKPEQ